MATPRKKLPDSDFVLAEADEVLELARRVRDEHRRRRRDDRLQELTEAVARINQTMRPVRTLVQAAGWRGPGKVPRVLELHQASDALQRERRKLRKMLKATPPGVASLDGGWS